LEDADDIVQDSYMKLWQHKKDIPFEKAKSWLFTTAYNGLINLVKKQKRTVSMETTKYDEPLAQGSDLDLKEIVDKSLSQLPQVQKTIILLRDLEGYNYKEIGEMLELSESQVKVYLFRGRKKIKNQLTKLNLFV